MFRMKNLLIYDKKIKHSLGSGPKVILFPVPHPCCLKIKIKIKCGTDSVNNELPMYWSMWLCVNVISLDISDSVFFAVHNTRSKWLMKLWLLTVNGYGYVNEWW